MKSVREQREIHDPESWFNSDAVDDDDGWLFDDDGAVLLLGQGERSMVGVSAWFRWLCPRAKCRFH